MLAVTMLIIGVILACEKVYCLRTKDFDRGRNGFFLAVNLCFIAHWAEVLA